MKMYINEAVDEAEIEIKLFINQSLYQKGFITQEMYEKAKLVILKKTAVKPTYQPITETIC